MIKINNLDKYYNKGKSNEIHVINNTSITLPDKGLISVLGPSGCGKTTLLNVIGGLDKASGEIIYDDLELKKYNMHKIDKYRSAEIGYVFQNYNLLLEETVYNNLAIALEIIGITDKDEVDKRIEYTLKAVGMYKYRKKRAYALSGGQQQRVSIARALIKNTKIIIADEPTGNLDNENTIEIMNILKKISHNSLVLLVTHNQDVANFYSDQIIKILDGKIIDIYDGNNSNSLDINNSNKVYLKDLKLEEVKNQNIVFKYYTNNDTHSEITLRIIEKNNTFYISADKNIKLLEESNLKVIDDHYKALDVDSLKDFNFDTSWYNNQKSKKNIFKDLFSNLVISYNKMRYSKKRIKFIYLAFFMIGIILAICTISVTNFLIVDDTYFTVDKNYYTLNTAPYDDKRMELNLVYEEDETLIDSVSGYSYVRVELYDRLNYKESISYNFQLPIIEYSDKANLNFIVGSKPTAEEIVISKRIADDLIKKYKNVYPNYEALLGLELKNNSGKDIVNLKICGVCDNSYALGYTDEYSYMSIYFNIYNYFKNNTRLFEIENKYNTYNIVSGRDLNSSDLDTKNILYSIENLDAYEKLGDNVMIDGRNYNVVGLYEFKNYETPLDCYIINSSSYEFYTNLCSWQGFYNYEIVAGSEAKRYNECIVSAYSGYEIGDKVNGKIVTGIFYGDISSLMIKSLYTKEAYILYNNNLFYGEYMFISNDIEKIEAITNIKVVKMFDYYNNPATQEQRENLIIFAILALSLLIVCAIFIYFVMHSRMVGDIYTIGVYRSLGASRGSLIKRYLFDILVMITLTSLIGYVLAQVMYISLAINSNNMIGSNVMKISHLYNFLGIIVIYLMSISFGLLPVILLLRKTPAEINSKYDM